jgi:hypothetical protein
MAAAVPDIRQGVVFSQVGNCGTGILSFQCSLERGGDTLVLRFYLKPVLSEKLDMGLTGFKLFPAKLRFSMNGFIESY